MRTRLGSKFVRVSTTFAAVPLILLVFLAVYFIDPAGSDLFPKCVFHQTTGLQCPGCGTTRAVHHLMHGRFATAFRFNPALIVVAPLAGYALASEVLALSGRRVLPGLFATRPRACVLLGVFVTYWIVRNLPIWS